MPSTSSSAGARRTTSTTSRRRSREMARVSSGLVLLQDAVRVSDRVEEAERLRDPSHRRHTPRRSGAASSRRAGLDVERAEHFVEQLDFASWLARTGCEGETAERVRELLAAGDRGRRLELPLRRLQDDEAPLVAILVDAETRLVVQGLTGSEGRFHGLRNRAYGTNVVAGVTPGRAARTSRGSRCSTPSPRRSPRRGPTRRSSSSRPGSPPTRSRRPSTPASARSSASPSTCRCTTCSGSPPTSARAG